MESAFNGNRPNTGGGNQFLVIGFTSYDSYQWSDWRII
jgi:hypothetical protein